MPRPRRGRQSSASSPSERAAVAGSLRCHASTEADVVWEGNVAAAGTSRRHPARSRAAVLAAMRIGAREGKTSPEELLAAAHAGCFAMSLASELAARRDAARAARRATARYVMDEVEGKGHLIVESEHRVRARRRESTTRAFAQVVEAADAGCPFSGADQGERDRSPSTQNWRRARWRPNAAQR